MEDGRDSSIENVEPEPEDDSFSLSDMDDTNHSSDNEQDKTQKSSADPDGQSGRSTAEPPSTVSEPFTPFSDDDSRSIPLDDSLAEEDAVLKNNLELMSETEDASGPHTASQDLQLSSDSSCASTDLNSVSKSENDEHSSHCANDVISQINSCLKSFTTNCPVIDSNDADRSRGSECQRTISAEAGDNVPFQEDETTPLRITPNSEKEAEEELNVNEPEGPPAEAGLPSFLSHGETERLDKADQEDVHQPSEEHGSPTLSVGETSQSIFDGGNKEVCDSESAGEKELCEVPVSGTVRDSLPVSDQPDVCAEATKTVSEDVKSDEVNLISVETSLNNVDDNERLQENKSRDVSEGDLNSVELNVPSEPNKDISRVQEPNPDVLDNVQEKSYGGLSDNCSDGQDEASSGEENAGENSVCESFSHLNGGLSESMDCDDSSFSGTQVATSVNSSDQGTKRVVTSNALNAAWKKAFANTARKYEASEPVRAHVTWKSPDLEETSNSGSSDASNDSSAQEEGDEEEEEEEEEQQEQEEQEDDAHDIIPTGDVEDDSSEVPHGVLSTCAELNASVESINPECEDKDPVRLAIPEEPPRPQSSKGQTPQLSDTERKNTVTSQSSTSGPGKRLFESTQSLSGTHLNMANPVPEYPQYLGVQPTVKFKCVRCGVKGFTSMMELKTHQLSCLKNSSPAPQSHQLSTSPSASTNFRITRKVYLCSACGTYYENWNLFLHMREVHKRHICLFCLGMFSQAEKLSLHLISKHKVTEGHYLSPEDFKCSYKGSCFLMCCTCEKMFTEDNFTNHLCRGDFVVCAVCGGEGIHLPSCQLSSSSRNQLTNQPKRLQPVSVPETVKSNQVGSQKALHHHDDEAVQRRHNSQSNNRGRLGKKAVGSTKPKQILKVKIPFKPPVNQDAQMNSISSSHSKRSNAHGPSSDSSPRPSLGQDFVTSNFDIQTSGSSSFSNLDKTINAVALGLTDEAREWEQQMEAQRKRIEEAKQIYTDSEDDSDGLVDESDLMMHSSSSDEEIMEVGNDTDVLDDKTLVTSDERRSAVMQMDEHPDVENSIQPQPAEVLEMPSAVVEADSAPLQERESEDPDDSDSEKQSLILDENQSPCEDEQVDPKSDNSFVNEEALLSVNSPKDDALTESALDADTSQMQENPESPKNEDLLIKETQPEEIPMDEAPVERANTEDTSAKEASHSDFPAGGFINPDTSLNSTEHSVDSTINSTTHDVEERTESRLVEGYTLAGDDVPETELSLEKPLHVMKTQEVLKECVRTLCWSCVYCSHAKKIAVNGKQLALHVLSEHRIVPADGTQNEVPAAERFIVKLKEALDPLHSMHFNTDSYDSTDVANSLPYDRSYECFHCHFYTRLHKELYIHNRKMHQKTILLCIMCKSNFYSYSELLCHLCPGIYIPQCNVGFRCCMCNVDKLPSAFRLMVHLRKRHHACDVCLETTDDQQKLSNHVWKHKLHHLCYRCGIAYRNKPDITKHLFWKHGTESVLCKRCLQKKWPHVYHFCIPPASFVCEECSATFSRAVALRVHKRLHSEDFRYSCHECEDKFISKKLLAKHKLKHEAPMPPVTDVLQEEEKENVIPEPETRLSPIPKSTEEENRPKASEEKVQSRISSPTERRHVKKKKHKRDEQEGEEEKQRKSVDVFDLPPLNLSSDSDSSEDEGKKESAENTSLVPSQEQQQVTQSPPVVAPEDKMEVEEPAPIIDGIWDKFQNFQASLEKRESLDDPQQLMRRTIMMDHDYCLPDGKPAGTVAASTLTGDTQTTEGVVSTEIPEPTLNVSANETPKSSPVKKKKTPKKRERQNSGRASSSSSSDSSSDSDSSSCSCGSNCSCSSSSSSSSGSSSSSSDSDDSSSSEGQKGVSRKERHKEKAEKEKEEGKNSPAAPEQTNAQPAIEEPHIDVLEAEPTIRESDLDTTETDTDEDFYDDNPQKLANELLQEKRNLMLLAAVAPINNGGLSPTQSPSSQPSTTVLSDPAPTKRKGKKHRKRQQTNSKQIKTSRHQTILPTQNILPSSEPQYTTYSDQSGLQDINVSASSQQYTSSLYYPQTPTPLSNSPGVGSPLSQASQSTVAKAKKVPYSKIHDYSAQSVGSGSETEGRTKRKRMRNRFYGFASDEDEGSTSQSNNKVRKSGIGTSYQSAPEPPVQPPLPPLITTIKRSQVQAPPPDPFYQSSLPSATWSTNLLPSVKSDSDNDSDVRQINQVNASSSSDTDSDDDAMQIAESPPPPQYEAPRTGENKDNLYCYCQCPYDEVSEMIACDGADCRIEWFHFECVGIMVPPKGQWYCPDCRRRMSGGQDYMLN